MHQPCQTPLTSINPLKNNNLKQSTLSPFDLKVCHKRHFLSLQ